MDAERRAKLLAEKARLESMLAQVQRTERMAAFERQKERGDFDTKYSAASDSGFENWAAGMASGAIQMGKGAGNMLGLVSDEEVRAQKEKDADLSNTIGGTLGQMTAQGVITAPVGGAVGVGAKALSRLPQAGRAAQLAARGLGGGYGRAAVEGTVDAAVMADPDRRGQAALEGSLFGMGTHGVLKAAGRGVRGLAQKSDDARVLETYAQQHGLKGFVPLAQAASDEGDLLSRGVKSLYKEALPYIPGVSAQFNAQERRLAKDFRTAALKEADESFGILRKKDFDSPAHAVKKLKDFTAGEIQKAVKDYDFTIPNKGQIDLWVRGELRRKFPNLDDATVSNLTDELKGIFGRYTNGFKKSDISGESLLEAKAEFARRMGMFKGRERTAAQEMSKIFDNIVRDKLGLSGVQQQIDDLAQYENVLGAWSKLKSVEGAVTKAARGFGEFTPEQLITAAGKRSPEQRVLGQTFRRVMKNKLGIPGAPGRWFGRAAAVGAAWQGGPVAALTGLGIGNALATESVQRAMMGDTRAQQFVINALRNHPIYAQAIESGIRAGVAGQAEQ